MQLQTCMLSIIFMNVDKQLNMIQLSNNKAQVHFSPELPEDYTMSEVSPAKPSAQIAKSISRLWWLPLLRGFLFLMLGCYALFRPGMTANAFAQVIGFFILVEGVFSVIAGITGDTPSRGWTIARGAIQILAGIFVFANSLLFTLVVGTTLVYLIAFAAIVSGIMEIVAAIRDCKEIEGEAWLILGGALSVVFGLILLASPLSFGIFMVRVIGGLAIFSGIFMIFFAFRLRKIGKLLADSED
jgi:uncharacterized membrane protein HdeD (DUF308 family)